MMNLLESHANGGKAGASAGRATRGALSYAAVWKKKKNGAVDLRAAHGVIRIMIFLFDDHTGETVERGGQGGKLPIYLSACAVRNTNRAPAGKTSTSSCLQDGAIMSHLSPSRAAPASDTCTAGGG